MLCKPDYLCIITFKFLKKQLKQKYYSHFANKEAEIQKD
jgi:hypothetical protein